LEIFDADCSAITNDARRNREGKCPENEPRTLRFGLALAMQFYRRIELYIDNDCSVLDYVSDMDDVILSEPYD